MPGGRPLGKPDSKKRKKRSDKGIKRIIKTDKANNKTKTKKQPKSDKIIKTKSSQDKSTTKPITIKSPAKPKLPINKTKTLKSKPSNSNNLDINSDTTKPKPKTPTLTAAQWLFIAIYIRELGKGTLLKDMAEETGIMPRTVSTWFHDDKPNTELFRQQLEIEINKHFKDSMRIVKQELVNKATGKSKKNVYDINGKLIYSTDIDARDAIKASEVIMKSMGELVDRQEVNQTVQGEMRIAQLDVNQLLKDGLLQSPEYDKEALIKSDDEFSFDEFKKSLDIDKTEDKE